LKGQSAARRTLLNAISSDRLHHALLFTGPRGTGKTSTARILAKILRCTNLQPDSVPCGKCEDCVEISAGRSLDVLEIDGASNNGVDSIRELRDQVSFNPSSGSKKIYIIDEVHMLSSSAFNALLKTLEEPPNGVYFMMATTEAHKLPKTILSRCQRYDFKPVPLTEVISLLKEICESEKVKFEDDALFLIAQMGEGSVRDSLSFLDQCITFADGELTKKSVIENLGVTDISHFKDLLNVLINRDATALVKELETINGFNIEPQTYLEELVLHIRNLILFKVDSGSLEKSEAYSEVEKQVYMEVSQKANLEDLYILFDICFKGTVELTRSFNPAALLDVTLLKAGTSPFYEDLLGAPANTQAQTASRQAPQKKTLKVESVKLEPKNTTKAPIPASGKVVKVETEKKMVEAAPVDHAVNDWKDFVSKVKGLNPVVGSKLEVCSYKLEEATKTLSISVDDKNSFLRDQVKDTKFIEIVQNYLKSFWDEGMTVVYDTPTDEAHAPSVTSEKAQQQEDKEAKMKEDVENHSIIKSMKEKYKIEIRNIKELK
jgi:DNA polymerase-3 subunit gamma/tau